MKQINLSGSQAIVTGVHSSFFSVKIDFPRKQEGHLFHQMAFLINQEGHNANQMALLRTQERHIANQMAFLIDQEGYIANKMAFPIDQEGHLLHQMALLRCAQHLECANETLDTNALKEKWRLPKSQERVGKFYQTKQ
jgi:hypothetical protein